MTAVYFDPIAWYRTKPGKRWLRQSMVHAAGCVYPTCAAVHSINEHVVIARIVGVSVPRSMRRV